MGGMSEGLAGRSFRNGGERKAGFETFSNLVLVNRLSFPVSASTHESDQMNRTIAKYLTRKSRGNLLEPVTKISKRREGTGGKLVIVFRPTGILHECAEDFGSCLSSENTSNPTRLLCATRGEKNDRLDG